MKTKPVAMLLLVLVAVAAVAAACGSPGKAEVRVEKGLAALAGYAPAAAVEGQELGKGEPSPVEVGPPQAAAVPPAPVAAARGGGGLALLLPPMGRGVSLAAPFLQGGPAGITVEGYGRATAPADAARVQFVVTAGETYYRELPVAPAPGEPPATPEEIVPTPLRQLTEADLAPLIDAIKAQGVSEGDIEAFISPADYYGPYGPNTARVVVNLGDPADRVGPLVDAASQAVASSGTLFLQNVSVLYTVDDCSALLGEARRAAVEDGRENGAGLAAALGVSLGEVLAASEYVYSPYGPSPCEPAFDTYYYPYGYEGMPYDPALPAEVQIVSNVTLTFAIR